MCPRTLFCIGVGWTYSCGLSWDRPLQFFFCQSLYLVDVWQSIAFVGKALSLPWSGAFGPLTIGSVLAMVRGVGPIDRLARGFKGSVCWCPVQPPFPKVEGFCFSRGMLGPLALDWSYVIRGKQPHITFPSKAVIKH